MIGYFLATAQIDAGSKAFSEVLEILGNKAPIAGIAFAPLILFMFFLE